MGFTPYCCGQCWKYQLLGRARESCPYLQPRVQERGSPMALQGMNQVWPEGAFTSHFWQTTPVLASPSHYSQGLSTLLQGNNSHRMGLSGGPAATWLGGPILSPGRGICAGEEEETELHRKKHTPRFAKFCWWRQQSLHSFLVPGTCCWTNKT